MSHEHLTRQWELLPPDKTDIPVTVIGAGAIGSFTVLALAKMGFTDIKVFDFDKIEVENMNCQFYRFKDIGKFKVIALQELVEDFTGVKIEVVADRYTGGKPFKGIVITAVDSMSTRKLVWDSHKEIATSTKFIVDPRMGAEIAMLYTMNPMSPEDIVSYEKTLYTDENSHHERCTAKATMYTALLLSGQVCKTVKDLVMKEPFARTLTWSIKGNDFQCWNADHK